MMILYNSPITDSEQCQNYTAFGQPQTHHVT